MTLRHGARLLSLTVLVCIVSAAQTFRGRLTGVITDPTGAVIAQAEVVLTNLATGVAQRAVSNEQGVYLLPSVEPGQYRLTVSLAGFKTFVQEPITMPVGGSLTLDVRLEVGEMAERITVTAEAPLLESETASFGQVVGERFIREMPLNARNPMILVTLTPGVITSGSWSAAGAGATNINHGREQDYGSFQIGGGRPLHNEILLDGAPNISTDRGWTGYIPPVDSTQEFKVEANPFSAEFDRTTGGVVNIVTKGGTNEFHGTLYEFFRSSKLDANDFFFNRAGRRDKPVWRRNQFGFNAGGPIKKDRTFFFGNYDGVRLSAPFTLISTVPTVAQRTGNFAATRAADGSQVVIYDPLTTHRDPATGALRRSPFAGNVIPPQRFDRVGAAVLNTYPQPNVGGHPITAANNFVGVDRGQARANSYGGRIDHAFGDANRMFARFSHRKDKRITPNRYGRGQPGNNEQDLTDRSYNATLSDVHIFSPTLTGEFRASFVRHHTQAFPPDDGFDLTRLGFPKSYAEVVKPAFPAFFPADLTSMGRDWYYDQYRDTVSVQGSATKLAGRHSLKSGFDFRVPRFHLNRNLNATGSFSFPRTMTQGPDPLRATATGGHGAASLLLGAGTSGTVLHSDVFSLNRHYYGFYFQDNWKVTNRLTVNLGLRYSLEIGQNESHDRMAFLDLDSPSPLAERVRLPLRGLLRFAGQGGLSRNLLDTDKNNFGPRAGFAYRLGDATVVRAGYGIFYSAQWISAYDPVMYASFNSTTEWVATLDGLVPTNYLSNPFPEGFNLPRRDRNPLTNVGAAISGWLRNERVGYAQQWNFSIQRQFGGSLLIEAAYWGNKGTKMENRSGWQENSLPNEHLALGARLTELVPNPFHGVIERGALAGPSVALRQLLLPFPQYTSVVRTGPSAGSSIYHAATLRVERRFRAGLSLLGSYTVSKLIDDFDARPLDHYNRRLERSVSAFDVPQRLVVSYVYELPVGRGRTFGTAMHPVWNAVFGGWSISGITTLQSGTPIGISRPSVNTGRSAKLEQRNVDRWFDTTVFRPAEPFTFGNVGRLLPDVRVDGVKNFDLVLAKSFYPREDLELKLRAEAFNAFNTPQFGAPGGVVGSAAFGVVSSQVNRPREIQFALQLYW